MNEINYNTVEAIVQDAEARLDELQRKVAQLERDNRALAAINQKAESLRLAYEAEKKLQYLYNDLLLENCPNMIFCLTSICSL